MLVARNKERTKQDRLTHNSVIYGRLLDYISKIVRNYCWLGWKLTAGKVLNKSRQVKLLDFQTGQVFHF